MIPQTEFDALQHALAAVDEEQTLAVTDQILAGNPSPQELEQALKAVQHGMEEVGRLFQEGEYFLAEMIYAAEIVNAVMPRLTAGFQSADRKTAGRVVLGTVKGDIHDIGKNLVAVLLTAAGFEVIDLGTDVAPERFVAAVRQHRPNIVAMSGLLTLCLEPMRDTVTAICDAGLRDQVKVLIGGNPVTEHIHRMVGSDGWSDNAAEGVALCRGWAEA